MVFDLLQLEEENYRLEPLKVRRRALEKLVKGQKLILPARRLSPNGLAAWTEILVRSEHSHLDPELALGQRHVVQPGL
jgi:ATP-dependent DNA ligase